MTTLILYVQDAKSKIRVAIRRWIERRKAAVALWLLSSPDAEDTVIDAVLNARNFQREVESFAETTVSSAMEEFQRERERDGIRANDIDGLDDEIDERIERACGNEAFDQAVQNVIDQHEFSDDDIKGLPQFIQEISSSQFEHMIANLSDAQVEILKQRLAS